MLTRLLLVFRSLSRSFSITPRVMVQPNGNSSATGDNKPLIPHAARLKEGRAIAEDVWSIFK
jgi:hypothetical protein